MAVGGAGALLLLATGKQAAAQTPPANSVGLFDKNVDWINPATEDTLKTRLQASDLSFSKELGRIALILSSGGAPIDPRDRNWTITETVPVSGSLGRTWTITEVVPISHANLDVALSTLAKESGGNLATLTAKDFATQTTLALIKLKTDNLDAALSTLATAAGQSATQPRNITQVSGTVQTARNWSTDFSKLDVALSTLATATGQSTTQPRNISEIAGTGLTGRDWSTDFSKLDVALSTRLKIADYVLTQELGRVGLILTAGGVIIDPRAVRTLTTTDSVEARPGNSTKTLAFASIDAATSGDNTIVAADASNKIKVTDYSIVCDAAVTSRWKSGASTNLSGAMSFAANGGIMAAAGAGRWLFETAVNQALVLNLGGAVGARGHVTYFKEAS